MTSEPGPESPPATDAVPPSSSRAAELLAARRRGGAVARALRRVKRTLRLWRLYWLRVELRLAPTEAQRLLVLTLVVGAACGLAAVAFHLAIRLAETVLIERALEARGRSWIAWTIACPTLAGVLCGAVLHYAFPKARGSGIPDVKAALAGLGRIRFRDSLAKFVLSAAQIGSGASLGREGPTVHICAGLAGAIGRASGVSPKSLRRLIPVGTAAAIAAAFNAPIAAVTFTVEEIVGALDYTVLSGVIVAAALAAVIERSLLGEQPVFDVPTGSGLHELSSLPLCALLGVAAALVAVAFTDSLLHLRAHFRRSAMLPAFARPGVGGLVTGVLAVVAMHFLGAQGVTGGGYATASQALAGALGLKVMLALCLMKVVATVFSYGSGGAGGIFAPSLFIGAMLGGIVGALDVRFLGHEADTVGAFALVGMGAVFAGIVRAPMTSVLIIVEMTGGYSLILPLMIANMSAYAIARRLRPTPIYEALLVQDGVHLRNASLRKTLEGIPLDSTIERDTPFVSFRPSTPAGEMRGHLGAQDAYPVLDAAGALVGLVASEELRILAAAPELDVLVNAGDIMRAPVAARVNDDVHAALEAMLTHHLRWLPVLDERSCLVGFIDETMIARLYLRDQAGTGGSP